jgi:hypothetical protein
VDGKWRLTHHLTAEKVLGRPLKEEERVHFNSGYSKKDYDNEKAVKVVVQGKSSGRRRLAALEARIAELEAEADSLRKELGTHVDPSQPIAAEALIPNEREE